MVDIIDTIKKFDEINRIEELFNGDLTVKEEVEVGTVSLPFIVYSTNDSEKAFVFDREMLKEAPDLMLEDDWEYLKEKLEEIL